MLKACATCGRAIPLGTKYCARCSDGDVTGDRARYQGSKRRGTFTTEWRRLRIARLQMDGGRCQLKHYGCTEQATTVHLDPACKGNHALATLDNTRSACRHCHGVEDAPRARQ